MGHIKFHYSIQNLITPIENIVNELEYGNTFALYLQKEIIIPLKLGNFNWISWENTETSFTLTVNDTFFDKAYFFEKILTSFIYNLQDFGKIKLEKIDLNKSIFQSELLSPFSKNNLSIFNKSDLILGTIIKPYYHLSLDDKINMAKQFSKYGFKTIKNDECYFTSKKQLINEAIIIQKELQNSSFYIPNITHLIHDYNSIEQLIKAGIKIVMVNVLVVGFRSINLLKIKFPELKIWGHRVGYSQLSEIISMNTLSILLTLSGIDFLHIGTPVTQNEIDNRFEIINSSRVINKNFKPIFTKTTPEVNKKIIKTLKTTPIYLGCGFFRNNKSEIDWGKVDIWQKEAKKYYPKNNNYLNNGTK